jgi:uncharacterized membrane protein YfcA
VEPSLLLVAGLLGGLAGNVAGLASLVSYPALLATGLPALSANVTYTVALVLEGLGAAAGSKRELVGQGGRVRHFMMLTACGGVTGSVLLLVTPSAAFAYIVPWLVGGSSLVLLLQPRLRALRSQRLGESHPAVLFAVFAIAVYGGYFGAAAGVLMVAVLTISIGETLVRVNALKNVILAGANGVAAVGFAVFGPVRWTVALPLAAGFFVGGWLGPAVARRIPANALRTAHCHRDRDRDRRDHTRRTPVDDRPRMNAHGARVIRPGEPCGSTARERDRSSFPRSCLSSLRRCRQTEALNRHPTSLGSCA